jgi:hypothetical protein
MLSFHLEMFARKIEVDVIEPGPVGSCPLTWLDTFAMRSFTGRSAFDDVLPTDDGLVEVSFQVELDALQRDMEDWFTRKFGQGQPVRLRLTERACAR